MSWKHGVRILSLLAAIAFANAVHGGENTNCACNRAVADAMSPTRAAIRCPIFWLDQRPDPNNSNNTQYLYFCDGYDNCQSSPVEDYAWFEEDDLYADSCEDGPGGPCDGPAYADRSDLLQRGEFPIPISGRVPANCELPPGLQGRQFTLLNNVQIKARVRVQSGTADPVTVYARVMTIAFRKDDVLQQRTFTLVWESERPSVEPGEDHTFRPQDFNRRASHLHRFKDNNRLYLVLAKQTTGEEDQASSPTKKKTKDKKNKKKGKTAAQGKD